MPTLISVPPSLENCSGGVPPVTFTVMLPSEARAHEGLTAVVETVMGEPPEIHAFLGSSRLAETIDRYDNVSLVVHGHAHRGGPEGRTNKGVPVYNVALPVLRTLGDTPYRVFEI